jgi:hypothetical protein
MKSLCLSFSLVAALCLAVAAPADINYERCGDELNISGATLFKDFFKVPGSTNDFIDVDGDGEFGFDPGTPWIVDQLAMDFTGCNITTYWLVQYRGVGSGNGLAELVDYHLLGELSDEIASGDGRINRYLFASGGVCQSLPSGCFPCADPETCSPICPTRIDLAVMDVPVKWFVQAGTEEDEPHWWLNPGQPGYGRNPAQSDAGQSNKLKTLEREDPNDPNTIITMNTNTADPDRDTIWDTSIAWVPIAIISNRGADVENVTITELRHLYLSGRLPNGENLVAATRDSGSGTRNGGMNSIGLDPSWAVGDNLGKKNKIEDLTRLGPDHQATNNGGSGIMEKAVQHRRLAVGYTGLSGGSRAAADAQKGYYEITNVKYDDRGGEFYVRPSVDNVLDNDDVNHEPTAEEPGTGAWQIGGSETFASRGDPFMVPCPCYCWDDTHPDYDPNHPNCADCCPAYCWNPQHPDYPPDPNDSNCDCADIIVYPPSGGEYLRNIVGSIVGFEDPNDPNGIDPGAVTAMPAEVLVNAFFLLGAVDALPNLDDPTEFLVNDNLNQPMQEYTREFSLTGVPPDGSRDVGTGQVPEREPFPCWEWAPEDPNDPNSPLVCVDQHPYSDGSNNGNYYNYHTDSPYGPEDGSIEGMDGSAASPLNERNKISGDFNNDDLRNLNDIGAMMAAYNNRVDFALDSTYYTPWVANAGTHSSADDPVVPEILGDFDGDGNFDEADIRYFADGLGLTVGLGRGNLDRRQGFIDVDLAWTTLTGTNNFFGTELAGECKEYLAGDSRGDVAGNPTAPGAAPIGADGIVDGLDIQYVYQNFGDWSDPNDALAMDLSADMDGNLVVDQGDVDEIESILGTAVGDVDWDCDVDLADLNTLLQHYGDCEDVTYEDGDLNGDGCVDLADLQIILANYGFPF